MQTLKRMAVWGIALALVQHAMAEAADTPASPDSVPPAVTVSVAAAADLQFAMDELVTQFAKSHPGIMVNATYGSSGNFFTQLSNGAPFDVFLSADATYPRQLAAAGHTVPGSEFLYAVGRIVLWVPQASPLDVQRLGMEALRDASVRHIAIANPRHAPYGRAAESAMRSFDVYDDLEAKLVFGENVAQAAQFVQSGAADAGIIALALALAPAMQQAGRYWNVPLYAYPRMEQSGVIMRGAREPRAARMLREFVLSSTGRDTLKRYGFAPPGE